MRNIGLLAVLVCALNVNVFAEPRAFDWIRASDEVAVLDPADFHAGRIYRPGSDGGNMHVNIQATQPVTIALTSAQSWTDAQQNPEMFRDLIFTCLREHVVSTTYECHLPPMTPMVLLVRDERIPNRIIMTGFGAIIRGGARRFISPNDLRITYFRWDCVENCIQPEFEWVWLVKEKYQLTPVPKLYRLMTPERDGQQVNVRFKGPSPMTIAVVPSKIADQIYSNPGSLNSALEGTTCKQRGVQSLTFECTLNVADGPQSLVIIPDTNVPNHKKAEIYLQTLQCTANCSLPTN